VRTTAPAPYDATRPCDSPAPYDGPPPRRTTDGLAPRTTAGR